MSDISGASAQTTNSERVQLGEFTRNQSVLVMPESTWTLVSESGGAPMREVAMQVKEASGQAGRKGVLAAARDREGSVPVGESVSEQLVRSGFASLDVSEKERSDQSTVRSLTDLNMAVATPRNEDDFARIGESIPEGFVAVRDFDVGFVPPVYRSDARAGNGAAQDWPELSGIAVARDNGVDGSGVLMGVLDSGVDAGHAEFAGREIDYRYVSLHPGFWPNRDVHGFDTDGHGTHVSGIIAGQQTGVAPGVKLFVASVIESETVLTSLSRVAAGLDWLLQKFSSDETEEMPAIINMSLGFPPNPPAGVSAASFQQRLNIMRSLLYHIWLADILPVVAIGNGGPGTYGQPGGFPDVVGVGAVDFGATVAGFSGNAAPPNTQSAKPDVFGYGVDVFSSIERDYTGNSHYATMSGTSMASPYVSGVAALYRSQQRTMTAQQTQATLIGNAIPVTGHNPAGAGLARFV